MKVRAMLDAAQVLLDEPAEDTQTVWPLGAAVLTRQAIERTVDVFWAGTVPAMVDAPMRDRLLALPAYLGRRPEVQAADYAWHGLSTACHHRDYDVGLTQAELRAHLDAALAFAKLVQAKLAS